MQASATETHLARIRRREMGRHEGCPSHEIGKTNIKAANADGPLGDRTLPPSPSPCYLVLLNQRGNLGSWLRLKDSIASYSASPRRSYRSAVTRLLCSACCQLSPDWFSRNGVWLR